MEKLLDKEEKL